MNDFQKAWSQTLKLLRDDGTTVLFGTALGAVCAVIIPYSIQFWHRGYTWVRQHWLGVYPRKDALAIVVLALVTTGFFAWPGPWILKWVKSLWQGVNRGLFLLPTIATFAVLTEGLQGMRAEAAEITGALLVIFAFAVWRSLAAQVARPAINLSENPLKFTSDDRLERVEFAKTVARDILSDGKPTYAIYGEFGSGKSTMLNSSRKSYPVQGSKQSSSASTDGCQDQPMTWQRSYGTISPPRVRRNTRYRVSAGPRFDWLTPWPPAHRTCRVSRHGYPKAT